MPAENPSIWLDGAHNADKMAALSAELSRLQGNRPLPVAVLAVLGAKDASAMISELHGVASTIVATEPQVVGKRPLPASSLAELVFQSGFQGEVLCESDVDCALETARNVASPARAEVLVTGSLYLVGQVRRSWYPDDEIVLRRSPWPRGAQFEP